MKFLLALITCTLISGTIYADAHNIDEKPASTLKVCYIANVSGSVQGVFFRVSTQQIALDYSLGGYARNLSNGDVEVLMCGEQEYVDKLLTWLQRGPDAAQVAHVQHKQIPYQGESFFSVE